MKKILFTLIMTVGLFLGTYISVVEIQAQPIAQPTYTPNPTLTPRPTYTDLPTYTPNPTYTPCPTDTPTPYPTSTPYPTATIYPTQTPYPISTPYPDQHCSIPENAYYVSILGNDNDLGDLDHPWRTIQKAANTMTSGDTAIILTGEYDERVQVVNSGEPNLSITYQAGGVVTMKGFTINADYIVVRGFEITDTDWGWVEGWGIYSSGSYNLIEENYVYYCVLGGIVLSADSSQSLVRNNKLYRNGMVGIEVQGQDNVIEFNEVWGTIQHHPKWPEPHPTWLDADGIRFFGDGHIIRGNYIHDILLSDPENIDPHIDCFQTWSDAGNAPATNIIIEQNYCEVLEPGMYAYMFEDASNITIRNNIHVAFAGVNTGGGGNSNFAIINNVFANELSWPQGYYPGAIGLLDCTNTIVKNNIFYNQPEHTISVEGDNSGQEIDYNLAYRSDGQPTRCYVIDYECVYPVHHLWDINPMFVDPLNGDYHLLFGSPAIDAGVDVGLPYYGPAPDIGAFELIQ